MSYSATINFKTIKEGELYAFFKQLKDACKDKFEEIAKDNFIYMPSVRNRHLLKNATEWEKDELDHAWMRNSVFSYRFFYIHEHDLLGVFGTPDAVHDIFDTTVYFQNSCDQDYEFDTWKGIPIFEEIAEKWKNATDEETRKHYHEKYDEYDDDDFDHDYYRKTFAYDEIWGMCEKYLYKESEVVYISMFGGYELFEICKFVELCRIAYEEWRNSCRERSADNEQRKTDD